MTQAFVLFAMLLASEAMTLVYLFRGSPWGTVAWAAPFLYGWLLLCRRVMTLKGRHDLR